MKARRWLVIVGVMLAVVVAPQMARADDAGGLMSGISDLFSGIFAIPVGVISGTLSGPLIIGTVGGALQGVLNTIGYTTRGVLQILGVAIPIATKAAPLIPVFL